MEKDLYRIRHELKTAPGTFKYYSLAELEALEKTFPAYRLIE
jgi:hypothetical protein